MPACQERKQDAKAVPHLPHIKCFWLDLLPEFLGEEAAASGVCFFRWVWQDRDSHTSFCAVGTVRLDSRNVVSLGFAPESWGQCCGVLSAQGWRQTGSSQHSWVTQHFACKVLFNLTSNVDRDHLFLNEQKPSLVPGYFFKQLVFELGNGCTLPFDLVS